MGTPQLLLLYEPHLQHSRIRMTSLHVEHRSPMPSAFKGPIGNHAIQCIHTYYMLLYTTLVFELYIYVIVCAIHIDDHREVQYICLHIICTYTDNICVYKTLKCVINNIVWMRKQDLTPIDSLYSNRYARYHVYVKIPLQNSTHLEAFDCISYIIFRYLMMQHCSNPAL